MGLIQPTYFYARGKNKYAVSSSTSSSHIFHVMLNRKPSRLFTRRLNMEAEYSRGVILTDSGIEMFAISTSSAQQQPWMVWTELQFDIRAMRMK